MTRHKLSPDILALNPALAAKQAKSKALTPSGRGHGYTDDAQKYEHIPADPRRRLWEETRSYLGLLQKWDDGSRAAMVVREACRNLLKGLGES